MFEVPRIVAVIDDDRLILQAMKQLLSALGYGAELYESSKAFLANVMGCTASCLMVDVQIGNDSGVMLAHDLTEAGYKFPIIFMSASNNPMVQRRAKDAGGIAFLHKPFTASALLEALAKSRQ
jgi:FixJ family two-component response regulator